MSAQKQGLASAPGRSLDQKAWLPWNARFMKLSDVNATRALITARRRAREALFKIDVDVSRYRSNSILWRRVNFLRQREINLVLDVGANLGQYGFDLRRGGYAGKIVSFEPLPETYGGLTGATASDPQWRCFPFALGDASGPSTFNVAGNTDSSSLLRMLDRHKDAAPHSAVVRSVTVEVRKLDEVAPELFGSEDRVMLKLDVQGFEDRVLRGAATTLERVDAIECELSIVPLYAGQSLLPEMLTKLDSLGFDLVWLEQGFVDVRNGHLLQVDGIFLRRERQ